MKKLKFLLPIILSLTAIITIFVVSQIPAKAEEMSGTCGDNLTWSFDEATGTLTISGTGDMTDYSYDSYSSAPWKSKWASIKTAKISEGVTSIGDHAFDGCKNLTSITIPSSFTSFGDYAFDQCINLKDVYITDIAAWCNIEFDGLFSSPFHHAKNLYCNSELVTDLVIPDGVTSISNCAFYSCDSIVNVTIPNNKLRTFWG